MSVRVRDRAEGLDAAGALFLVGRCVLVVALFSASDLLHSNTLTLIPYATLLLTGSALLFTLIQRAYKIIPSLSAAQMIVAAANGALIAVSLILYSVGLKHCGPVRTLLMDFADHLLVNLPWLLCGWSALSVQKRVGIAFVCASVALLFISADVSVHDTHMTAASASLLSRDGGAVTYASIGPPRVVSDDGSGDGGASDAHSFSVLYLSVSESTVGMIALILASALSHACKAYETQQKAAFGGRTRLHAISMAAGALLMIPLLVAQTVINAVSKQPSIDDVVADSDHASSYVSLLLTVSFLCVFFVVLQFYVDDIGRRVDIQLITKANLILTFLVAVAVDWYRTEGRINPYIVTASATMFAGVHYLTARHAPSHQSPSELPVYVPPALHFSFSLTSRERSALWNHVMSDRTSTRIVIFLTLNLLFMFVEMLVGYFSNSLGLISDAGHMLFDCTALAIGLYAKFISAQRANNVYTYGYGRWEIISGFVNGIFLLFIGYFILVESVERLFAPPNIRAENLFLVSTVGLMINLIGLCFFHDHHGGHGHSHAGGHGHSHGGAATDNAKTEPLLHKDGHDEHGHEFEHEHEHEHGHGADGECGSSDVPLVATNHNILAIYLHILADTLGSVGVIISSLLVQWYGLTSADAVCSIIISVLIIGSVFPFIRSTVNILLQRTPADADSAIRVALQRVMSAPGVVSIRDPHFWTFCDGETIGSINVQIADSADEQTTLAKINEILRASSVDVRNMTVQIEKAQFVQQLDADTRIRAQINLQAKTNR